MIKSEVGKKSLERNVANYQGQRAMGVKSTLGVADPKNVLNNPKMQDSPIPVGILGNTKPIDITKSQVSDTISETQNKLGASSAGAIVPSTSLETQATETQDKSEGIFDRVIGNMGLLSKKGDRTAELQAKEDVVAKKKKATEIEAKYDKTKEDYDDRLESLRTSFQGTTGGADVAIRALERERDSHLADIAIDYKVSAGAYKDAIEIVDLQIENEFAPLEDENKNLIALYGLVQNDLSESESMAAQVAIQEKQDAVAFEKQAVRDAKLNQWGLDEIDYRARVEANNNLAIPTLTGKPQNATQTSANGYADRLNESNIVIDDIGGNFTGKLDKVWRFNFMKSADQQSFEQAKDNFVTAVLRRESGAVISDSEFDREDKKYFPQPGDKPETVAQKAVARNTAINNLYREANVVRPVLPGQIVESGGNKFRVASDGETLELIQ